LKNFRIAQQAKVTIIPRGPALGYTLQLPLEDKYLTTRQEIQARLAVLMGGRVAEELTFNEITTGAQNDISKATEMAQRMVTEFGMSDRVGALSLRRPEEEVFLGRDINREPHYSNKTSELIDDEVKNIIENAKSGAEKILRDNQQILKNLADRLVEKEILDADEVNRIIAGEPEPEKPAPVNPEPEKKEGGATEPAGGDQPQNA
jgi:cell division protease FtsH